MNLGKLGGIIGAGLLGIVLASGCDNYESRITNAYAPAFSVQKNETIEFYRGINPWNLTEKQKNALDKYNANPGKYSESINQTPWINSKNPTVRDKIFIVTEDDVAESMVRMLEEAL